VAFIIIDRAGTIQEFLDVATRVAGVYRNKTRPVSYPVFFQACGTLRGKNAQVPEPPMLTSAPI
jgi:hypothetical protein